MEANNSDRAGSAPGGTEQPKFVFEIRELETRRANNRIQVHLYERDLLRLDVPCQALGAARLVAQSMVSQVKIIAKSTNPDEIMAEILRDFNERKKGGDPVDLTASHEAIKEALKRAMKPFHGNIDDSDLLMKPIKLIFIDKDTDLRKQALDVISAGEYNVVCVIWDKETGHLYGLIRPMDEIIRDAVNRAHKQEDWPKLKALDEKLDQIRKEGDEDKGPRDTACDRCRQKSQEKSCDRRHPCNNCKTMRAVEKIGESGKLFCTYDGGKKWTRPALPPMIPNRPLNRYEPCARCKATNQPCNLKFPCSECERSGEIGKALVVMEKNGEEVGWAHCCYDGPKETWHSKDLNEVPLKSRLYRHDNGEDYPDPTADPNNPYGNEPADQLLRRIEQLELDQRYEESRHKQQVEYLNKEMEKLREEAARRELTRQGLEDLVQRRNAILEEKTTRAAQSKANAKANAKEKNAKNAATKAGAAAAKSKAGNSSSKTDSEASKTDSEAAVEPEEEEAERAASQANTEPEKEDGKDDASKPSTPGAGASGQKATKGRTPLPTSRPKKWQLLRKQPTRKASTRSTAVTTATTTTTEQAAAAATTAAYEWEDIYNDDSEVAPKAEQPVRKQPARKASTRSAAASERSAPEQAVAAAATTATTTTTTEQQQPSQAAAAAATTAAYEWEDTYNDDSELVVPVKTQKRRRESDEDYVPSKRR